MALLHSHAAASPPSAIGETNHTGCVRAEKSIARSSTRTISSSRKCARSSRKDHGQEPVAKLGLILEKVPTNRCVSTNKIIFLQKPQPTAHQGDSFKLPFHGTARPFLIMPASSAVVFN